MCNKVLYTNTSLSLENIYYNWSRWPGFGPKFRIFFYITYIFNYCEYLDYCEEKKDIVIHRRNEENKTSFII